MNSNVTLGIFSVAGNMADGGGGSTLNVNSGVLDMQPSRDAAAGSIFVDTMLLNGTIRNALNLTVTNLSGSGACARQSGVATVLGTVCPGDANNLGTLTLGALVLSGATVLELDCGQGAKSDRIAA